MSDRNGVVITNTLNTGHGGDHTEEHASDHEGVDCCRLHVTSWLARPRNTGCQGTWRSNCTAMSAPVRTGTTSRRWRETIESTATQADATQPQPL